MLASGWTTNNMCMEFSNGLMENTIKDSIQMEPTLATEYLHFQMAATIKGNF